MRRLAQAGIVLVALVVAAGSFAYVRRDEIARWLGHSRYMQARQDELLPDDGTPWVRIGARVRAYRLPALSGTGSVAIPMAGHWTVVNYWASWCGPCRREMPLLASIAAEQAGNQLVVVGIAIEPPEDARAFVAAHPTGYPVAVEWPLQNPDSSVPLGNLYGLLPATFLIDPQGRLQHRRIGPFEDAADLHDWLDDGGAPAD